MRTRTRCGNCGAIGLKTCTSPLVPTTRQVMRNRVRDHSEQVSRPMCQRVIAIVKRLHHDQPGAPGDGGNLLCLRSVRRERLLAQHVLAGIECSDRPSPVQPVRQRVVDSVDVRILDQRGVAVVDFGDVMLRRECRRAIRISRRDRNDFGFVDRARRPHDRWWSDLRRTEDADPKRSHSNIYGK